jgi:hypothetical protein
MANRGILFVVWGEYNKEELIRSVESISSTGLPYVVRILPTTFGLHNKAWMYDLSPYDETLYLDTDTVVMGDLGIGWDQMGKHGLSLCICEAPFALRFEGIKKDIIEYNTGVMFFKKDPEVKKLFDKWKELTLTVDDRCYFFKNDGQKYVCPKNDQASFAVAVDELNFNPAVLPMNFNIRPLWHQHFFGQIKVWHDHTPPPQPLIDSNKSFGPFQGIQLNKGI